MLQLGVQQPPQLLQLLLRQAAQALLGGQAAQALLGGQFQDEAPG
jgi:hypothetical protein